MADVEAGAMLENVGVAQGGAPARDHLGMALVGLTFIAFANASNMVLARWNMGVVPPFALAFFRFLFFGLGLLPFCLGEIRARWPEIRSRPGPTLAAAFCGMFLCGGPAYTAGETTTAINIGLIMAATPVVVILLSWLLRLETVRPLQILGICIALPGVILVIAGGKLSTLATMHFNRGDLIISMSMVAWAIYNLVQLRAIPGMSAFGRAATFAIVGSAMNLPIFVKDAIEQPHAVFSGHAFLMYVFAATVPGILAYVGIAYAANRYGAVRASLTMYIAPIAGTILSIFLLSEGPALYHLIGGGFILAGVWLSLRR